MVIYCVCSVVPFTYILEGRSHNSSLAYKVFYRFKVLIECCPIQWSVLLNRESFNMIASINLAQLVTQCSGRLLALRQIMIHPGMLSFDIEEDTKVVLVWL